MAMAEAPRPPGMMLLRAPHRAMFLGGCAMLLASFALWAVEIAARAGVAGGGSWTLPPAWMHALLVLGGVFPFFIFGFLLTAMPRWQGVPDLVARDWSHAWYLLAAGWSVALAGMLQSGLLVAGLVVVLA
nr:NnrS family protein [Zoogloeaceae bacterium]